MKCFLGTILVYLGTRKVQLWEVDGDVLFPRILCVPNSTLVANANSPTRGYIIFSSSEYNYLKAMLVRIFLK